MKLEENNLVWLWARVSQFMILRLDFTQRETATADHSLAYLSFRFSWW